MSRLGEALAKAALVVVSAAVSFGAAVLVVACGIGLARFWGWL